MKYRLKNKGFTLIELLVVIAIIGLLSSVVLASLNTARAKGRDAKRLSDIKQLQIALELYLDDNGSYPVSSWVHSDEARWETSLGAALSPYISTMPEDPLNNRSHSGSTHGAYQYVYSYYSNGYGGAGKWYMIPFRLENDHGDIEATDGARTCNAPNPSPDHVYRGAISPGIFHYGRASGTYKHVITVGGNCIKS